MGDGAYIGVSNGRGVVGDMPVGEGGNDAYIMGLESIRRFRDENSSSGSFSSERDRKGCSSWSDVSERA